MNLFRLLCCFEFGATVSNGHLKLESLLAQHVHVPVLKGSLPI